MINHRYAFNSIESETRFEPHADLITSVPSEVPYVCFGYSGGGNLVFRTAKELERRGESVSDIVMLDSRFLAAYRFPSNEARQLAQTFLDEDTVGAYAHN
jgi:thioesterase domain-containing protein